MKRPSDALHASTGKMFRFILSVSDLNDNLKMIIFKKTLKKAGPVKG